MKSKTQTPLGYLMQLLDVRLKELGDYLYVAQASVSKWRTGARPLRRQSQHLAGIVDYFIALSRDEQKKQKLTALFRQLYAGARLDTNEGLSSCLFAFLSDKTLPSGPIQALSRAQDALYRAEFSVYSGEEGRLHAMRALCEKADVGGQDIVRALVTQAIALDALLPLLSGRRTLLLLIAPELTPLLFGRFAPLCAHPRVETRLLRAAPAGLSSYVVMERGLLLASQAYRAPCYTALFTDEGTVRQHQATHEAGWREAQTAFTRYAAEDMRKEGLEALLSGTVPEALACYVPLLPHYTMSRELLMEVLSMNGVSGREWTRVLGFHAAVRALPLHIYLPASALFAAEKTLPELFCETGKTARLTDAQARRHRLDTAALVRAGAVTLKPVQADPAVFAGLFCRRNGFAGLLDGASEGIVLSKDGRLIDACMAALNTLERSLSKELREPGYVAGLLERAGLGEGSA